MKVEDSCAIVTGAAGGLGRCFTRALLKAGASVHAGDVDTPGLDRLWGESSTWRDEGHLVCAPLDVTDADSVRNFVERAFASRRTPDILINNAGILRDGLLVHSDDGWTRKLPVPNWQQAVDVNLNGPFLMAREFVAQTLERNRSAGVIINISSISSAGNPGQSNYAAAKAGLDACTRTWALELAQHGIRVCGVAPGLVPTPMVEQVAPEILQQIIEEIPIGRPGTPEEIWLAVKFAIECEFFTGEVLSVDGGARF